MRFTISREPPMRAAISCWVSVRAHARAFCSIALSSINLTNGRRRPSAPGQGLWVRLRTLAISMRIRWRANAGLRSSNPSMSPRGITKKRHGSRVMIEADRGPPSRHLAEVVAHADGAEHHLPAVLLAHERLDASGEQDVKGVGLVAFTDDHAFLENERTAPWARASATRSRRDSRTDRLPAHGAPPGWHSAKRNSGTPGPIVATSKRPPGGEARPTRGQSAVTPSDGYVGLNIETRMTAFRALAREHTIARSGSTNDQIDLPGRRISSRRSGLAALLSTPLPAYSQAYPARTVRIVIPSAGRHSDILARTSRRAHRGGGSR